jgi:hypothetical protein
VRTGTDARVGGLVVGEMNWTESVDDPCQEGVLDLAFSHQSHRPHPRRRRGEIEYRRIRDLVREKIGLDVGTMSVHEL